MVSRRQFLLGTSGAVAAGLVLPGPAGTGWAQEPDPSAGPDDRGAFEIEQRELRSPINLPTDLPPTPNSLTLILDYPNTAVPYQLRYSRSDRGTGNGCMIRRRDETIKADGLPDTIFARLGDSRYRLTEFHFHTPSEHTVGTNVFAMEQHFVDELVGDPEKILVVGVLLTRGGNAPQDNVLKAPLPRECGAEVPDSVNLRAMLPSDLTHYRYLGSLTTRDPDLPDSDMPSGVRWQVMRSRVGIAPATIDRFRGVFTDNARDVQDRQRRPIRLAPGRFA